MQTSERHSSSTAFQSEKILVRGVNWLGDAVMSTPALQRLREAKPDAHITLLTPAKLADLWLHHPDLDAVSSFQSDETVLQIASRLRAEKYQVALVLPNSPRSALEVFLGRIPQRIGYRRPWRSFLLTQSVTFRSEALAMRKRSVAEIKRLSRNQTGPAAAAFPAAAHHIYHYLHLVAALGANPQATAPRLVVTDKEMNAAGQRFGMVSDSDEGRLWFGLNPGAEYGPAKRWPHERFIAAAIALRRQTGSGWVIFGGKADVRLATAIAAEIRAQEPFDAPILNLAGKTSLRELCALLKRCSVLLTNDSGPMHVAAAVGTPVVVPFGSTAPEFTGPGLPGDTGSVVLKSNVSCAPCFRRECPIDFRCMREIGVEEVVKGVLQAAQRT